MSESKQINETETTEVTGGRQIKTTCYKCGKEITLNVADPPMVGYPTPICLECSMKQNKAEAINSGELDKVSGGNGVMPNPEKFKMPGDDPVVTCTCRNCGKEYTELEKGLSLINRMYCRECREKILNPRNS